MLQFVNVKTGESMDHIDFVEMVWGEAEEKYEEATEDLWCNLNAHEQNQCYCAQFEEFIKDGWRFE